MEKARTARRKTGQSLVLPQRYIRNVKALSEKENDSLALRKVAVIGCGGLGGSIIEMLARVGVGHLAVVDPDTFDETNLNRQLLCTEKNLGQFKALAARERVVSINSLIEVKAVCEYFTEDNAADILADCDCVVDALDSIAARRTLAAACAAADIPFVYGAIAGWYGQVSVVYPEDAIKETLFSSPEDKGAEVELGNLPFTAACVASYQAAEAVKVLLNRPDTLHNKLLMIDLSTGSSEILEF